MLLRGARQLLTLRGPIGARRGAALGEIGVIPDGAVLIRDGRIVEVGASRRVENLKEARGALEVPVTGKVVMPGFIDPGLNVSMYDREGSKHRKKSAEFLDENIRLLRSCLQHGTVAAEVKTYGCGFEHKSVIPALRQLQRVGENPVPIRRTWCSNRLHPAEFASEDSPEHALDEIARRKLADFVEIELRGEQSEDAVSLLVRARVLRLGIKARWSGDSPQALPEFLQRTNPWTLSVPAQLDPSVLQILSASPSILVFSPGQEILDGASAGDSARHLIDAGAAVALSSGYNALHPTSVSMQMAIALSAIRLRFTAEEAISAATINAAWAAGVGERKGSLEVGKQADLLVMNLNDYRDLPRQFGINHVGMVIRDGAVVFNRTKWRFGAS